METENTRTGALSTYSLAERDRRWDLARRLMEETGVEVLRVHGELLAEVCVPIGMEETQHQVSIALGDVHEAFERAAQVARRAYDAGLEQRRYPLTAQLLRVPGESARA